MLYKVIIFFAFIQASLQASTPSSSTYEAGVLEFHYGSLVNMTSQDMLNITLTEYLQFMDDAPSTLDLIVFPEMTFNLMLTALEIPEPDDKISPCNDDSYEEQNALKQISCSAKKHNRYTVVNMVTKAECPDKEMIANEDPRNCSARSDGFSYYNTNVIFDRNGTVISRYRKYNLFGESVDKPHKPAMVTFETDFGVTFGHFICFDLAFKYPAVELIRNYNLTDIIFTTMWFSEAPYLTAVQVQQNWAHTNNINLIASGANNVARGSTGTGIYGGKKGAYVMDMSGTDKSKLFTATVHKIKNFPQNENIKIDHVVERYTKDEMKDLYLKRDQLDVYDMQFLDDSNGDHYVEKNICKESVCCNMKINYTISNTALPHYQYTTAFYHGKRTFDGFADGGVITCSIIACQTTNVSTCGVRLETLNNIHIWRSIEVKGDLPTTDGQFLYMPTSLDTSILPLNPEEFEYTSTDVSNDKVEITMKLIGNGDNLLAFGIYGRDFNLDVDDSATGISASIILIFSLLVVAFTTINF